ncbi:MAG: hypothetical protein HOP08_04375 [Cyclobacteriaceae bacterium]|nr:hypothetical protein [Cyclobacteriaceae bacterium]
MKVVAAVLLFFTLLSHEMMAQDSLKVNRTVNFLAFSGGGSFAMGSYSESVSIREGSGFAGSGYNFQIEYAGFWSQNAGLGTEIGMFSNSVNRYALASEIATTTPPSPGTRIVLTELQPWKSLYVFAGPYVTLPLKNIHIDFKALAGIMGITAPAFNHTVENITAPANPTLIRDYSPIRNFVFGYGLGSNIRLKLDKAAQLKFGIEFMQATSDADYSKSLGFTGNRGTQNISNLNLSWGLAFNVGK